MLFLICKPQGFQRVCFCLFFFAALLCFTPLVSQSLPTLPNPALELQRQEERERLLREREAVAPDVRGERAPAKSRARLPLNEAPCFPIQDITLSGNEAARFSFLLPAAHLAGDEEDSPIGRCIGNDGISLIMQRMQETLVEKGYVTSRVVIANQALTEGTLALHLIAGRIGKIRFAQENNQAQEPAPNGYRTPRLVIENNLPMQEGDLLNLRDIEQALENLKRVPTVEADIAITPSEDPAAPSGTSDLVISWQQAFPIRLSLSADDSGSYSTGKYQGSATLSWDNPLGFSDLFYITRSRNIMGYQDHTSGNHGTQSTSLHYALPIGYWQVAFNRNVSDYHQTVAGFTEDYVYSGKSSGWDIKLSRLLYRDATRKTTASAKAYVKTSNNYIDDTEVEVQRRRMAGWEAAISHKEFLGNATVDTTFAYRHGTGAFSAMPAPEENFNEGTSRPQIRTLDVELALPFTFLDQNFRYSSQFRAQWNSTPLIAQDRFSIGGRNTVRGFDGERVLSAERGRLCRNELTFFLGQSGQSFYAAIDTGYVSGESSDDLLGKSLTGAAIGVRGGFWGFSYDVFTSYPVKYPEHFAPRRNVSGVSLHYGF